MSIISTLSNYGGLTNEMIKTRVEQTLTREPFFWQMLEWHFIHFNGT